jgi:hypothetical protein
MKKSLLFFSGGVLITAFVVFGLRSLNFKVFQSNLGMLIVSGTIGVGLLVYGLLKRGK